MKDIWSTWASQSTHSSSPGTTPGSGRPAQTSSRGRVCASVRTTWARSAPGILSGWSRRSGCGWERRLTCWTPWRSSSWWSWWGTPGPSSTPAGLAGCRHGVTTSTAQTRPSVAQTWTTTFDMLSGCSHSTLARFSYWGNNPQEYVIQLLFTSPLRYEDISFNTLETSQKLFKFLNLKWIDSLTKYINSHTKKSSKKARSGIDPYGTVRDSKAAAVKWTNSLSMKNISAIQEACRGPMGRLGYRTVENSNDLIKYKESLKNLPEINGTDYVQSDWRKVCWHYWPQFTGRN